ncbi:hypothetical protein SAMN05444397_11273 [Flavobacterium aquidurense]|uniref:Uncharacterized protein n=1 Tax=Flavobacterium frigidimaris TaxID=262320 RepID=A0ABX4BKZ7_FLAFR|nr:hypothetical protein [Flavobacterium frigidimaris]OXA75925.1 hypothetical protein B0A65_20445 [Flavobacterium frigidimaris]SDZ64067.1 hypothetical protein SAMN05444397_11273 [Flavobacterium aquidurense]
MLNFDNAEILEFINSEIPTYQRELLKKSLAGNIDSIDYYEQIGRELSGETNRDNLLLITGRTINKSSFYEKVKDEVYKFICTEVKGYKTERDFIGKNFKELVTIISTAIASTFSLGVGVIVGIITNILIAIAKVGKNAWCELQKENIKLTE